MNDQLQAALTRILAQASDGITAGTQFLYAQLPDLIQQLLLWKMVSSLAEFFFGALLLVLLGLSVRLYFRTPVGAPDQGRRQEYKVTVVFDSAGEVHPGIIGVVMCQALMCLFAAILLNLQWLQIWIAPKIFLIEYAAKLAK